MKREKRNVDDVLNVVLKDPFSMHTITSIAENLRRTRQGVWKTVKKLEKNELLRLERANKKRTSSTIIKINWKSLITDQTISLLLTKESLQHPRWRVNFGELEKNVDFLIIFGSILHTPKEANDIDVLAVIKKKNFKVVEDIISKIQKTQLKKIHLIDITKGELEKELKKPNESYREAIRKGIVLFGQKEFTRYMRGLKP